MCNSDFSDSSFESCRVILAFSHEVPICNVSAAVAEVFRPVEEISFDGLVTRAGVYIKPQGNLSTSVHTVKKTSHLCHTAICGNSGGDNPLNSLFTWFKLNLAPSVFCATMEVSNILSWFVPSSLHTLLCNGSNPSS